VYVPFTSYAAAAAVAASCHEGSLAAAAAATSCCRTTTRHLAQQLARQSSLLSCRCLRLPQQQHAPSLPLLLLLLAHQISLVR
jgi:hypothetical protein